MQPRMHMRARRPSCDCALVLCAVQDEAAVAQAMQEQLAALQAATEQRAGLEARRVELLAANEEVEALREQVRPGAAWGLGWGGAPFCWGGRAVAAMGSGCRPGPCPCMHPDSAAYTYGATYILWVGHAGLGSGNSCARRLVRGLGGGLASCCLMAPRPRRLARALSSPPLPPVWQVAALEASVAGLPQLEERLALLQKRLADMAAVQLQLQQAQAQVRGGEWRLVEGRGGPGGG